MWTTTITPRFGDTDVLGHINNTVLAIWFEQARNPLFRIFSPDLNLSPETFPLIMAHTDYDFVGELFLQHEVEIRSGVSRIGNKSFTLYHEARQQERLCVKGHAVIVYYNFKAKQSVPIPDAIKKQLEAHLLPEA
ncbi:MAG: acyl-CoA thioesterase [Treponema sp.]|jgi:acyl-CoA thioester hydrolase|nr:acyl-CoA thioesterase [Treponema sp.]